MNKLLRNACRWIEQRTGLETKVRDFLFEEIPASAGWPQVFGSVALFLFFTQALTGILLALNYAPTPGDAYSSVSYIVREVTGGKMIRGLHHWGASLMMITVVLHMLQVFLYGAYKKPREATWIAGVILLLVTLAFGLTGYLLPWDNRAYWGTMVTTRLAAQAPFIGSYLSNLLGAANGIGVITFSRFYALHTLLLPLLMIALVALHVYLVRRHGVTPSASDSLRKQRFYPSQAYRDTVAVFIAFLGLFFMAALVNAPLEGIANPNDATYVPRPEWYFLFLFQALKYFHGVLEPVGSIGLPTAAVAALIAIPFIDRSRARALNQRRIAMGFAVVALAGWGALTAEAIVSTPNAAYRGSSPEVEAQTWTQFPVEEIAAVGYFRKEHCLRCHNLGAGEPKPGPNLNGAKVHHSPEWLAQHFNSQGRVSASETSANLSISEINALSLMAAKLTAEKAAILESTSSQLTEGAEIYLENGCAGCHKVNGVGGDAGPSLNGISKRRSGEWMKRHFLSPSALTPGSIMPPYQFSRREQAAIVSYLLSLPD